MGLAVHRPPIYMEVKVGTDPVKACQYLMTLEAKKGITPNIKLLLELGVLTFIQLS